MEGVIKPHHSRTNEAALPSNAAAREKENATAEVRSAWVVVQNRSMGCNFQPYRPATLPPKHVGECSAERAAWSGEGRMRTRPRLNQ